MGDITKRKIRDPDTSFSKRHEAATRTKADFWFLIFPLS